VDHRCLLVTALIILEMGVSKIIWVGLKPWSSQS
jgi:hypothetical protein